MGSPSRLLVLIASLAMVAVVPATHAASGDQAGASKRRACGTIPTTSVYRYARVVAIRHVSCRTARRVAKAYDARGRIPGSWRCALAHSDRPRLFSCGSGASRGDLRKFPRALEAVGTSRRSSARAARCGSVTYGGRTYVMFHARIRCPSARRKIRYVHRYKRLPGWKCESGTNFRTGGGCRRGRKQFNWHPAD